MHTSNTPIIIHHPVDLTLYAAAVGHTACLHAYADSLDDGISSLRSIAAVFFCIGPDVRPSWLLHVECATSQTGRFDGQQCMWSLQHVASGIGQHPHESHGDALDRQQHVDPEGQACVESHCTLSSLLSTSLSSTFFSSAFAELFYGGAAATLARWPNKAADGSTVYAYTWSGVCGGPLVRGGCEGGSKTPPCDISCTGSLGRAQCSSGCTGITWRSNRTSMIGEPPAAAHNWAAAPALGAPLLHGFWTHEWRDIYVPITGVNVSAHTIYASDPTHVAFNDGTRNIKRGNSRWYALNIRSELDQPGEYYIHRNASNHESGHGMVYLGAPSATRDRGELSSEGAVLPR